jgi:hypothetical protein
VAYRKLISLSPSALLPEERFRLYALAARFPQKLSGQVPWQPQQAGVYDCKWGTDVVRVIVAGELPRETHNAPLHLFSASPELIGFGSRRYQRHSEYTSGLLVRLFDQLKTEGLAMAYTMADFQRDFVRRYLPQLTPEERLELLQMPPAEERMAGLAAQKRMAGLAAEERLAGLSEEEIQRYLHKLTGSRSAVPPKRRRKR